MLQRYPETKICVRRAGREIWQSKGQGQRGHCVPRKRCLPTRGGSGPHQGVEEGHHAGVLPDRLVAVVVAHELPTLHHQVDVLLVRVALATLFRLFLGGPLAPQAARPAREGQAAPQLGRGQTRRTGLDLGPKSSSREATSRHSVLNHTEMQSCEQALGKQQPTRTAKHTLQKQNDILRFILLMCAVIRFPKHASVMQFTSDECKLRSSTTKIIYDATPPKFKRYS